MKRKALVFILLFSLVLSGLGVSVSISAEADVEAAWNETFRAFVMEEQFLAFEQMHGISADVWGEGWRAFALHDMDGNGIPELFIFDQTRYLYVNVYTFIEGSFTYLDRFWLGHFNGLRVSVDLRYPGFFLRRAEGGYVWADYFYLRDGAMGYHSVFWDERGERTYQTDDHNLYTASTQTEILQFYTLEEIEDMTWEEFVSRMRFAHAPSTVDEDNRVSTEYYPPLDEDAPPLVEYDHALPERPEQFEPPPEAVSQVIDPETAAREIEDTIRNLTPQQRESGDALSAVSLHIEQAERRGTTQRLPQGGSLDAAALRELAVIAQDIRRSTESVLRDEDVRLHRNLRTNLNFETGERRSVALEFPEDVADVAFDNLTIEAVFASATVSREYIAEGTSLQLDRVERTLDGDEATLGWHLSNILGQERTFGEFLLTFWAFIAIALMLIAYIVLALIHKRLRAWVLPTFIGLAIVINFLILWISYDPDDHADFLDGVIEVSMSEGMHATLSLPVDGIRGNPENLVLFNGDGEPQFTKLNPSTGSVDARIHTGGSFTLREHTVSFADIEGRSELMRRAIETIASRGIMSGVTENEFAPDELITRSEFVSTVVMAFDMLDMNARSTLIDLEPSAWYYHAIATAELAGLVHVYEDGTFRGGQNIRKDELTVVSANALVDRMGYITPTDIEPILARYLDRPEIERWAEGGVALATESNVLLFREDGLFGPAGTMTRGDAAIILYRLFNRVW